MQTLAFALGCPPDLGDKILFLGTALRLYSTRSKPDGRVIQLSSAAIVGVQSR